MGLFDVSGPFMKIFTAAFLAVVLLAMFFAINQYNLIFLENSIDRETLVVGDTILSLDCLTENYGGHPVKALLSENKIDNEILLNQLRNNNINCVNYNKEIYVEIYDNPNFNAAGLLYGIGDSTICKNPFPNICQKLYSTSVTTFPAALKRASGTEIVNLKIFIGPLTCGDGILETWEECDIGLDRKPNSGDDVNTLCLGMCTFSCQCKKCGNGHIDPGEQCDGSDLGGETCLSRGYTGGGNLKCVNSGLPSECKFDESGCKMNQPPTALFIESVHTVNVGDIIIFDASGSSDSDGIIISYWWDFGDGNTATVVTTSHSYSAAGSYTVTLTVTDDKGASSTATALKTVNPAPVPCPDGVCDTGETCRADDNACLEPAVCYSKRCVNGCNNPADPILNGQQDTDGVNRCDNTQGCAVKPCVCDGSGNCISGAVTCPDGTCKPGENCPADASACPDNKCYEPTCTSGCGQTPVPNSGTDEACNVGAGCATPPCICDGSGNCISGTCTCSDGTSCDICSSNKPKYCDSTGKLVDDCVGCECPNPTDICNLDGTCSPSIYTFIPPDVTCDGDKGWDGLVWWSESVSGCSGKNSDCVDAGSQLKCFDGSHNDNEVSGNSYYDTDYGLYTTYIWQSVGYCKDSSCTPDSTSAVAECCYYSTGFGRYECGSVGDGAKDMYQFIQKHYGILNEPDWYDPVYPVNRPYSKFREAWCGDKNINCLLCEVDINTAKTAWYVCGIHYNPNPPGDDPNFYNIYTKPPGTITVVDSAGDTRNWNCKADGNWEQV